MATKKMNLVQLTFIVAVNMMGSGIIMLPTNMAKVGAKLRRKNRAAAG